MIHIKDAVLREKFIDMFLQYGKEIGTPDEYRNKDFIQEKYLDEPHLDKQFIYRGSELIGFLITEHVDHLRAGYIVELYIVPAYRRQKIAERTVREYMNSGKDSVFFWYLVDGNEAGRMFWDHIAETERLVPHKFLSYQQQEIEAFGGSGFETKIYKKAR